MQQKQCSFRKKFGEILIREVRPEDASDIVHINIDGWKVAYRGIFPDRILDSRNVKNDVEKTLEGIKIWQNGDKKHSYFVAEKNEKIVGCARGSNGISENYDAQIQALYVAPSFHGQKIGTALVKASSQFYFNLNKKGLVIFTAKGNPYCRFYEKLGGEILEIEKNYNLEGVLYPLIGYGWSDITTLFSNEI